MDSFPHIFLIYNQIVPDVLVLSSDDTLSKAGFYAVILRPNKHLGWLQYDQFSLPTRYHSLCGQIASQVQGHNDEEKRQSLFACKR